MSFEELSELQQYQPSFLEQIRTRLLDLEEQDTERVPKLKIRSAIDGTDYVRPIARKRMFCKGGTPEFSLVSDCSKKIGSDAVPNSVHAKSTGGRGAPATESTRYVAHGQVNDGPHTSDPPNDINIISTVVNADHELSKMKDEDLCRMTLGATKDAGQKAQSASSTSNSPFKATTKSPKKKLDDPRQTKPSAKDMHSRVVFRTKGVSPRGNLVILQDIVQADFAKLGGKVITHEISEEERK